MVNYNCLEIYTDVSLVNKYCYILEQLIRQYLNKVYKKLKQVNIEVV